MEDLKARGSADEYRRPGRPARLLAAEFSRDTRNLVSFTVEPA